MLAEGTATQRKPADVGEVGSSATGEEGLDDEPSTSNGSQESQEDRDAARVQHAKMQGAVYVTGRSNISPRSDSSWLRG